VKLLGEGRNELRPTKQDRTWKLRTKPAAVVAEAGVQIEKMFYVAIV
jgi:hypothetical protein